MTTSATGVNGCDYHRISTFALLSGSTQSECHWQPAYVGNYTLTNSCETPTVCSNPADVYVSNTACSSNGRERTVTTTCYTNGTTMGITGPYAVGDGGAPTPNCSPGWYVSSYMTSCYRGNKFGEPAYPGNTDWCYFATVCHKPDVRYVAVPRSATRLPLPILVLRREPVPQRQLLAGKAGPGGIADCLCGE